MSQTVAEPPDRRTNPQMDRREFPRGGRRDYDPREAA